MRTSIREEFLNILPPNIDTTIALGYDFRVDEIEKGMKFIVSPNFAFPNSRDTFSLEDATKNDWVLGNSVRCHYSDVFLILDVKCKSNKKGNARIRVKNLRTDVDFNLLTDDVKLPLLSTTDLYFI